MQTAYEYAITVMTGRLPKPTDWATLSEDQISKALAIPLGQIADNLAKALPQLPPGDWEAVSHDLAIYGQTVIVSFLIRRPQ